MTQTAKDDLANIDSILSEYENSLGLPEFKQPVDTSELDGYLNMNRNILEKLTSDDCGYIAYRLSQSALYIRRAQNREKARIRWAEKKIDRAICTKLQQYSGYGYKERAPQAIKDDEYASKLDQIALYAGQRFDRLEGLSDHIKNLAELIRGISWNKRKGTE